MLVCVLWIWGNFDFFLSESMLLLMCDVDDWLCLVLWLLN